MGISAEPADVLFHGDERTFSSWEKDPKSRLPAFLLEAPGGVHKATKPRHVLLIEDDLDTVHSMAAVLRQMGHHVDYAINGYVGMDVALRSKPEFIFLDLGLPGVDGFEVCRRLRAVRELAATRIVAITAYAQESFRERALAAGAEMVLVKPVEMAVIEALLSAGKRGNGGG